MLEIPVGNYRCAGCRQFFKPVVPFAPKGKRYTARAVQKANDAVQQDKSTYLALPNRLSRDFSVRPCVSTVWTWFQEHAGGLDIEDYLRWACGRFSGQLSVDSIHDGDKQMWFATDPLNRDLILGYHRADHADAESLTEFLTRLRDVFELSPSLVITDDAQVFDTVPERIWSGVPIQLCHFHAIKRLSYDNLRVSLRDRINALKPNKPATGKPTTREERARIVGIRRQYRADVKAWADLFRRRRLFLKSWRGLAKPKSVELREAEFLTDCCAVYPTLATFRALVLDFYTIFDSKDADAAELLRQAFLAKWESEAEHDAPIRRVLGKFRNERWFAKLFRFAAFENAQRTTNSTERANRWFRKRQKHHYRSRKEHTIKNMLHADLVYRRDRTPEGETPNRLRKKAAPLQRPA